MCTRPNISYSNSLFCNFILRRSSIFTDIAPNTPNNLYLLVLRIFLYLSFRNRQLHAGRCTDFYLTQKLKNFYFPPKTTDPCRLVSQDGKGRFKYCFSRNPINLALHAFFILTPGLIWEDVKLTRTLGRLFLGA